MVELLLNFLVNFSQNTYKNNSMVRWFNTNSGPTVPRSEYMESTVKQFEQDAAM